MSKNKERDKMIQYGTHRGHILQEIRVIITNNRRGSNRQGYVD